ncbi:D-3-phosphoglycerate dehydrogenase [Quillaja saponaria]|uniref:D-3-phosphoglycerate dehydrogenase n=1 Tax=Quillaja saponaria TaxID=32244 RepID=A0AAD7LHY1_QUISA|nr:D-3-phosphoglycerate dehydrogenase [Quillaja saponaria]
MSTKGSEFANEQGAVETKVETVDYRSPAGEDKEPTKEDIEIVHLSKNDQIGSGTKGGPLASAAAAVADTFQSVKDTLSGSGKDTSTTTTK